MTPIRVLLPAFLAGALMLPVAANAITIRADFTGIVSAEQSLPFAPRPPEYYDGYAVTGFFEVDAVAPLHHQVGDYYLNLYGSQRLSYTVRDQTFDFHNPPASAPTPSDPYAGNPGVLQMHSNAGGQSVTFMSNIFPKYDGAVFGIEGPAGSLFDAFDPATTLRLTPGVNYSFGTGFTSGAASMHFGVALASMNIRVISPVPEPSVALLLLGGGVALAWQQRRRRAAATVPAL
jgi:PEP-CTERM motif-containing protein